MNFKIFYHKNCLDGVSSAALMKNFLNTLGFNKLIFKGLTYPLDKKGWRKLTSKHKIIILDYRYHPQAAIWCDHHKTTFTFHNWEKKYKPKPLFIFDPNAPSATGLLYKFLKKKFNFQVPRDWEKFIKQVDKYDSARFDIKEALELKSLAAKISIIISENKNLDKFFIQNLFNLETKTIENLQIVKNFIKKFKKTLKEKIEQAKKNIILENKFFLVWSNNNFKNQFVLKQIVAFYLYPRAKYLFTFWRERNVFQVRVYFNSFYYDKKTLKVHLGELAKKMSKGGGGHKGVGAFQINSLKEIERVKNRLKSILK